LSGKNIIFLDNLHVNVVKLPPLSAAT